MGLLSIGKTRARPRRLLFGCFVLGYLLVIYAASASTFNTFLDRWGFRFNETRFALDLLISERGHRPFVYRRLMLDGAGMLVEIVPDSVFQTVMAQRTAQLLIKRLVSTNCETAQPEQICDRQLSPYVASIALVMYFLVFIAVLCFSASMWWLGSVCFGPNRPECWILPPLATVLIPYCFVGGGYFYDFPEFALLTAVTAAALSRRVLLLILLAILSAYNKETVILLLIGLGAGMSCAGLLKGSMRWGMLLALVAAAGIYASILARYQGYPGSDVQDHLWANLAFWLSPMSYIAFYNQFSGLIPVPQVQNVIIAIPLAVTLLLGYRVAGTSEQYGFLGCLAVVLPMCLLFANTSEARNLAVLFPLAFVLIMRGIRVLWEMSKVDQT